MDNIFVSFIMAIILDINDHRFEVFAFFSEIHEHVCLVLVKKNTIELNGTTNSSNNIYTIFLQKKVIFLKDKKKI